MDIYLKHGSLVACSVSWHRSVPIERETKPKSINRRNYSSTRDSTVFVLFSRIVPHCLKVHFFPSVSALTHIHTYMLYTRTVLGTADLAEDPLTGRAKKLPPFGKYKCFYAVRYKIVVFRVKPSTYETENAELVNSSSVEALWSAYFRASLGG